MKHQGTKPRRKTGAFTLFEILTSVLVIGVLSSVGLVAMKGQSRQIAALELKNQISALNAAVQGYELSGGVIPDTEAPEDILAKLKSYAQSGQKHMVNGISESFIDPRVKGVRMSAEETLGSDPRALWKPDVKRFVLATSGSNGIREFIYDDNAVVSEDPDARNLATRVATTDTWVWDYTDRDDEGTGPDGDSEGNDSTLLDIPIGIDPSADVATKLLPPEFSVASGIWLYEDFGFPLELYNPNPQLVSAVLYTVNGGPWTLYEGPITIGPNTEIEARSKSLDPPSYSDSEMAGESYLMEAQQFSGDASGSFQEPNGAGDMVYEIDNGEETSSFQWGVGVDDSPASSLSFTGGSFNDVLSGEMFNLGSLDYFNGTIYGGTGADQIKLKLGIEFHTPEIEETFTFRMDLINTTNYGVDADADADYVRIRKASSVFSTELNGISYELALMFGYEGPDGFSTVNRFHVHEGSGATADIYGVFVEVSEEDDGG